MEECGFRPKTSEDIDETCVDSAIPKSTQYNKKSNMYLGFPKVATFEPGGLF